MEKNNEKRAISDGKRNFFVKYCMTPTVSHYVHFSRITTDACDDKKSMFNLCPFVTAYWNYSRNNCMFRTKGQKRQKKGLASMLMQDNIRGFPWRVIIALV